MNEGAGDTHWWARQFSCGLLGQRKFPRTSTKQVDHQAHHYQSPARNVNSRSQLEKLATEKRDLLPTGQFAIE